MVLYRGSKCCDIKKVNFQIVQQCLHVYNASIWPSGVSISCHPNQKGTKMWAEKHSAECYQIILYYTLFNACRINMGFFFLHQPAICLTHGMAVKTEGEIFISFVLLYTIDNKKT